jgi:hypothetical protein
MSKLLDLLKKQNRDDYVTKEIEDVYNMVAEKTGRTPEEIAQIGGVESQHGKYTDNMKGSSAKGLFQIMPSIAKKYAPNEPIKSLNTQEEILTKLINENQEKIGKDAPIEDLYTLHNLGLGKGKGMIASVDDKSAESVLGKKIIESNPKLYKNKTVGEAKQTIRDFLKERGQEFEFTPDLKQMISEQPIDNIQEMNPNKELVEESNLINDILQSVFTERENRLDKKENDRIENEFFKALEEKRKERAMKVKEKYGK